MFTTIPFKGVYEVEETLRVFFGKSNDTGSNWLQVMAIYSLNQNP
jgi:hypothetical protein